MPHVTVMSSVGKYEKKTATTKPQWSKKKAIR